MVLVLNASMVFNGYIGDWMLYNGVLLCVSSCLKHLNSGGCHHFAMRKLQIDEIESRSRHVTIKLGVTWSSKALIYGIY